MKRIIRQVERARDDALLEALAMRDAGRSIRFIASRLGGSAGAWSRAMRKVDEEYAQSEES